MSECEIFDAAKTGAVPIAASQHATAREGSLESSGPLSKNDCESNVTTTAKRPATIITGRRSVPTAGSTISKASTAATVRTAGGVGKLSTRSVPNATRRPTTSAPISSHYSRPSVSASEDEKKSTTGSNAPRRISSHSTSPATTEKRVAALTGTTARKPPLGLTATSSKPTSLTPRTGSTTTGAPATRSTTTRPPTGSVFGNGADARKRLSMTGTGTAGARQGAKNSTQLEASADNLKAVEDMKSKLVEKENEAEALRAQITSFGEIITELQDKLDNQGAGDDTYDRNSKEENADTLQSLELDHDAALALVQTQITKLTKELRVSEAEFQEAIQTGDTSRIEVEKSRKTLETLQAENEKKLAEIDIELLKALDDHAGQIQELRKKTEAQQRSGTALNSSHESIVAELQNKIDELTTSLAVLESSNEGKLRSEREVHVATVGAIKNEMLELKAILDASSAAETTAISELTTKLANANHEMVKMQSTATNAQNALADKASEILDLKTMHDQRMRQISQDYENEIESLRGDAFFKRKFEELEGQHNDLKIAMAEATDIHGRALAAAHEEHAAALHSAESAQREHLISLETLRQSHAEEREAGHATAAANKEAFAIELETLNAHHAKQLCLQMQHSDAAAATQLEESNRLHALEVEILEKKHADDVEQLLIAHESDIAATKSAVDGTYEVEISTLRNNLNELNIELERAASSSEDRFESYKRELHENHVAEVDKLIAMQTETMASLKADGAEAKKDLEELAASHTQALEKLVTDYRSNSNMSEEKLSQQIAIMADMQAALDNAQESLVDSESEVRELSQQLAQEKMERITALAELDAAKNSKADTSVIEALQIQLAVARKEYDESLSVAIFNLQAKQDELDSTKMELSASQTELAQRKNDLELANELSQAEKAEAFARQNTFEADYQDLNDSMTALVEEANSTTRDLKARVEELESYIAEKAKILEEMQAQLKVRDAELAEAKTYAASTKTNSLGSNRHASTQEVENNAAAKNDVAEGEDEDDHSSAALALLSKMRLTAKQLDAIEGEISERNLQALSSITNVKQSA